MKNDSLKKLVSIGLAVSAGVYLALPALASDSIAKSSGTLAQSSTPSSPSKPSSSDSSTPSSPSKPSSSDSSTPSSPSKPSSSDSSSTSSKGVIDQYQTGQKLSQAVKDTIHLPGGWLCLNSPNPQCNQSSK